MSGVEHLSEWGQTDDGWHTVACSCGWGAALDDDDRPVYPDTEEAADAWGDHMWSVGYEAGAVDGETRLTATKGTSA